jgi:hypothetical protein
MTMRERLPKSGPRRSPADTMKWVLADRPEEFRNDRRAITGTYNDKLYVLVSTEPDKQLVKRPRHHALGAGALNAVTGQYGEKPSSASNSIRRAQNYFAELTRDNKGHPLRHCAGRHDYQRAEHQLADRQERRHRRQVQRS